MRAIFTVLLLLLSSCSQEKEKDRENVSLSHASLTAPEPTGGPSCASDTARRCTMTFSYVDRGEKNVELRGDFRADGWTHGVPMIKRGKTWLADVDVPYGRDLQYKLILDGARWIRDPAREAPVAGSDNSGLDAVTCNPHHCAAAP